MNHQQREKEIAELREKAKEVPSFKFAEPNSKLADQSFNNGLIACTQEVLPIIDSLQHELKCANYTIEEQKGCFEQNGEFGEENQQLKEKLEIAELALNYINACDSAMQSSQKARETLKQLSTNKENHE